ncbi:MAG: M23 family metallopeptidase [Rhodospirillales bacterium]|nr:M23 family metallopeptidase [Rhodospirillales bacterium]
MNDTAVEECAILRDNRFMWRDTKNSLILFLMVALGGCSWAEWPPPSQVRAVNAPLRGVHTAPAPRPSPVAPSSSSDALFVGAQSVVVGRGDTLYAVSRRHQVSARAIIDANGLLPPYKLEVGQRLVLPRDFVHAVVRGDTLSAISRTYGVRMYVLAKANGLEPPYLIKIGQKLRVPGKTGTVVAQARPKPVHSKPAPTLAKVEPKREPLAKPPKASAPVPKPPRVSGKGFSWPARGKIISGFGPKTKGFHNDGINIATARGAPVYAAENGVVAYAGNQIRGFGNLLLIKHSGGWITAYAHNDALLVKRGQKIRKGQVIAKVGSSGNVSTPQLHFELRKGRRAVDPIAHLRRGKLS